MGPHVGGQGGGKRVVGNLFQPVAVATIPRDLGQGFEREHELCDGTKLDPVVRASSGQPFGAGEHPSQLAVVPVKMAEGAVQLAKMAGVPVEEVPDRRQFDAHGNVDHMTTRVPRTRKAKGGIVRQALLPVEHLIDEQRGDLASARAGASAQVPGKHKEVLAPPARAQSSSGRRGNSACWYLKYRSMNGSTRASLVASKCWASTLSATIRGHQSTLPVGPNWPSSRWLSMIALVQRRALRRSALSRTA